MEYGCRMKFRELSDSEKVLRITTERDHAAAHDEKNYQRSVRNRRYYWAIDADRGMGQYPDKTVQELIRQRRSIATFDFCSPTIDFLAGSLAKSPIKIDYMPVNREMTSLTQALKDRYYVDRDVCDWPEAVFDVYLNGLIYRADAEIYAEDKYDKTHGNIGVRVRLPGTVLYDPFWKTRPSRECRKAWVDSWMTPMEMLEQFEDRGEEINRAVFFHGKKPGDVEVLKRYAEYQATRGDEYGDNLGAFPYNRHEDVWGSQFRVTSEYRMEKVKRKRVYAVTLQGQVAIPEKLKEPEKIINWLNENFLDEWDPEGIFEEDEEVDLQICTSICPQLDFSLILQEKPTRVQCNRLQFHPFSASRLNGEFKGLMDSIVDAQEYINYLLMMQMHATQTTGLGGAMFADRGAFASDQDFEDFRQNRNNPSKVFALKRGALKDWPNGPSVPVIKPQLSAESLNLLDRIVQQIYPKISRVTPASRGEQEGSNQSGYLYRQLKQQSDVQQYTIAYSARLWWQEIAESYMWQACEQYGNGIESTVFNAKTGTMNTINQHRINGDRIEIVNDFSKLRENRHRVIAIESDDSPSRQIETMIVTNEVLKALPPERALMRMELSNLLIKSMDQFSEEDKERLEAMGELEGQVVAQTMKNNLMMLKRNEIAINQQVQQAQAGMPVPMETGQSGQPGQPKQ